MGSLFILDKNPLERRFIAALSKGRYDPVVETWDARTAAEGLLGLKERPDLIVVALDPQHHDALVLLRWMRNARSTIPIVVIARGAPTMLERRARLLGARCFVHDPGNAREMASAMREAVRSGPDGQKPEPPMASEVNGRNLTQLVSQLNASMKCPAGRDQVFLQSFMEFGQAVEPRVCLRCPLRAGLGLPYYVSYEHIRDICCDTPAACDAMTKHRAAAQ